MHISYVHIIDKKEKHTRTPGRNTNKNPLYYALYLYMFTYELCNNLSKLLDCSRSFFQNEKIPDSYAQYKNVLVSKKEPNNVDLLIKLIRYNTHVEGIIRPLVFFSCFNPL